MSNDITINLKTLGKRWDSPIISIGACAFDLVKGKTAQTFYVEVEFDSAVRSGRVDGRTIAEWMLFNANSRQLFQPDREKHVLATSLQMFGDFIRMTGKGVPTVWHNGASSDIAILEHAYDVGAVGLSEPWIGHQNIRDMATLMDLAIDLAGWKPTHSPLPNNGNAKEDAVFQAELIMAAWSALNKKLFQEDEF